MLHQSKNLMSDNVQAMPKKYHDVVRKLFEFSKLDLCEMLLERDKRFSEQGVKRFIKRFDTDLDVSVEVFRCILCVALELDTSYQYAYCRVLAEMGARYLMNSVSFCRNWTLSNRQVVLEYCMQAILLTKESVLKEDNNGQSRNQ